MIIGVWHSEYETGNLEIDDQHKTLFKIINNLAGAISQGSSQELLKQYLDELINDTTIHFKTEEKLVGSLGYSGYICHRAAHENLQRTLLKVLIKFEADSSSLTLEIVESMKDLILDHICEEDLPMMQSLMKGQDLQHSFEAGVAPLTLSSFFET